MIVKKIAYKVQKSCLARAAGIYGYINDVLAGDDETKVVFNGTFNIKSTDPDGIIVEIATLASQSKRAKQALQHWILSLQKGERFTPDTAREAVKIFCEKLGYEGCQAAYAAHGNTDNMHIHLLINRVDPVKKVCRHHAFDVMKAHKAIAVIAKKFGFGVEKNSMFTVDDDGEVVRARHEPEGGVKISDKARAAEVHSGVKSAERIAAEVVMPRLMFGAKLKVKSWKELHEAIAAEGFEYAPKGGGAVFRMHTDGETVDVKASTLHRKLSLKNMEKALGPFVANDEQVVERHAEAIDGVPQEVVEQYEAEKKEKGREVKAGVEKVEAEIRKEEERKKEDFKTIQTESWKGMRLEVAALMRGVKEFHDEKIDVLKERRRELLAVVRRPKIISLEEWARERGMPDADMIAQAITSAGNFVPFPDVLDHVAIGGLDALAVERMREDGLRPALVADGQCVFAMRPQPGDVRRRAAEQIAKRYGGTPVPAPAAVPRGRPCSVLDEFCEALARYFKEKREALARACRDWHFYRKRQEELLAQEQYYNDARM